jgi:Zn-finger nucleic acid-binding protein
MRERNGLNEKGMFVCANCNYEHKPSERTVMTDDTFSYSFCPKCGEESVWLDGKKHEE